MKLATYLTESGLSDEQFAKMVFLTIHAIRKYKSGQRFPKPQNMMNIKKATKGKVKERDWYRGKYKA